MWHEEDVLDAEDFFHKAHSSNAAIGNPKIWHWQEKGWNKMDWLPEKWMHGKFLFHVVLNKLQLPFFLGEDPQERE